MPPAVPMRMNPGAIDHEVRTLQQVMIEFVFVAGCLHFLTTERKMILFPRVDESMMWQVVL